MNDQDHVDDLIAAYVLGAVTPDEAHRVEAHLASCSLCRRLESELRQVEEALPLLAAERDPSPALKERLMAAVAAEPRRIADLHAPTEEQTPIVLPRQTARRMRAPVFALAAAALVLAVLGIGLWRLLGVREPGPHVYAMTGPAGTGQLRYDAGERRLVLDLHRLKALPPHRVYELWLIRKHGSVLAPTPVAVFRPTPAGTGSLSVTGFDVRHYQLAALTIERGMVPAPTSAPVATANL